MTGLSDWVQAGLLVVIVGGLIWQATVRRSLDHRLALRIGRLEDGFRAYLADAVRHQRLHEAEMCRYLAGGNAEALYQEINPSTRGSVLDRHA